MRDVGNGRWGRARGSRSRARLERFRGKTVIIRLLAPSTTERSLLGPRVETVDT